MIMMMERVPDEYFDKHHIILYDPGKYFDYYDYDYYDYDPGKFYVYHNHDPGKFYDYYDYDPGKYYDSHPNNKFPILRACHHVSLVAAPVKAKHLQYDDYLIL